MTNFFKSLFGSNRRSDNQVSDNYDRLHIPEADLFIDSEPPVEKEQPNKGITRVKEFLSADHFSAGRRDGYEFHNEESLKLGIRELKSVFVVNANAVQEFLEEDMLHKRKKLIELGEMLPNIKAQLDLDIEHLQSQVAEVNFQKMMSVDGEGWIAPVLHAYEKGFQKGMADYLELDSFTPGGIL